MRRIILKKNKLIILFLTDDRSEINPKWQIHHPCTWGNESSETVDMYELKWNARDTAEGYRYHSWGSNWLDSLLEKELVTSLKCTFPCTDPNYFICIIGPIYVKTRSFLPKSEWNKYKDSPSCKNTYTPPNPTPPNQIHRDTAVVGTPHTRMHSCLKFGITKTVNHLVNLQWNCVPHIQTNIQWISKISEFN